MDLIFETTSGSSYTIEVTYFDSVLQIKDKIEQKAGYPASGQVLVFNGVILPDDLKVHSTGFVDETRITLLFSKIRLLLKLPFARISPLPIDFTDTILQLKHKIRQTIIGEHIAVDRLQIYANGIELLDQRTIQDCGLLHDSEVVVRVRPQLNVTLDFRGQKIPMDVNPSDKVGELKNKLANTNVDLPSEYFFVHGQQVMEDDRSFRWHGVARGDTIYIFSGSVVSADS